MITSKTDYVVVDTASISSNFITGEILPARANKATARFLRWEDILFLQEAYLERACWRELPLQKYTPKSRLILTTNINSFTNIGTSSAPNADYVDFCSDSLSLANLTSPVSISTTQDWWKVFTGRPIITSLTSPVFISKSLLCADGLRRAFWNVQRLKNTSFEILNNEIVASYALHSVNLWEGSSVDTGTSSVQVGDRTTITLYSKSGGRAQTWRKAESITYADNPITLGPYPFAVRAVLLVCTHSTGANGSAYEIVPVQCTVQSQGADKGLVEIPRFIDDGFVANALFRRGSTLVNPPKYGSGTNGSVSIEGFALVVEHDFPAEIGSLNWSWQPS